MKGKGGGGTQHKKLIPDSTKLKIKKEKTRKKPLGTPKGRFSSNSQIELPSWGGLVKKRGGPAIKMQMRKQDV